MGSADCEPTSESCRGPGTSKLRPRLPPGAGADFSDLRNGQSFPLRLQPICNCSSLIFLKITCSCLARERTAVSVRFIRMPIALGLSPVSANLRSLSSSACVHGREAKCSGSVIGPRAPRVKANYRAFEVALITSCRKAKGERAKAARQGLATQQCCGCWRRSDWLPPDRWGRRNGRRRSRS
jgi:hypothetical protein